MEGMMNAFWLGGCLNRKCGVRDHGPIVTFSREALAQLSFLEKRDSEFQPPHFRSHRRQHTAPGSAHWDPACDSLPPAFPSQKW